MKDNPNELDDLLRKLTQARPEEGITKSEIMKTIARQIGNQKNRVRSAAAVEVFLLLACMVAMLIVMHRIPDESMRRQFYLIGWAGGIYVALGAGIFICLIWAPLPEVKDLQITDFLVLARARMKRFLNYYLVISNGVCLTVAVIASIVLFNKQIPLKLISCAVFLAIIPLNSLYMMWRFKSVLDRFIIEEEAQPPKLPAGK